MLIGCRTQTALCPIVDSTFIWYHALIYHPDDPLHILYITNQANYIFLVYQVACYISFQVTSHYCKSAFVSQLIYSYTAQSPLASERNEPIHCIL